MSMQLSAAVFLIFLCCGGFAGAADRNVVSIATKPIVGSAIGEYRALVAGERERGNVLVPRRTLTWTYQDHLGKFLLATVKDKRSQSCVVYLLRGSEFISLGGNDYCKWSESPKLVWREKKAWIEFPQIIRQPKGAHTPTNEFTAHFNKSTGDICILGLPLKGYDAIRCVNDEAPDSE